MAKVHINTSNYPGDSQKRLKYLFPSGIEGIFTKEFMTKYTEYQNLQDFLMSINCDMSIQENTDDLDNGKYDEAIKKQTEFHSWEVMLNQACQEAFDPK